MSNFNDQPESYSAWKASFVSVIKELDVSPLEEMDLLVKWLDGESRKHALSIRASSVSNLTKGIERIWERLNEIYGSP